VAGGAGGAREETRRDEQGVASEVVERIVEKTEVEPAD
jgi:hypothetical protein